MPLGMPEFNYDLEIPRYEKKNEGVGIYGLYSLLYWTFSFIVQEFSGLITYLKQGLNYWRISHFVGIPDHSEKRNYSEISQLFELIIDNILTGTLVTEKNFFFSFRL